MKAKELAIIIGVAVAAVLLALAQLTPAAEPAISWGLSFQQQGQLPQGPASARQLEKYGAAYAGDSTEKVLYLTFDAGYENGCTEKILEVLEKHSVPAAFFLVGDYLQKNGDLVRQMVEAGHIVGNHTLKHPDMSKLSGEEFARQLQKNEELFFRITGKEMPKYYRPPQGVYSEENLQQAQELGYHTVFWSLAYADWDNKAQPSREQALNKLLPRTHNGAVVLLHATSKTNAQILDELLTLWKQQGYRFAPLSELF